MLTPDVRVLVAGYGLPAEFAINALFGLGLMPNQIAVATHDEDARNAGLHALVKLRGLACTVAAAKSQDFYDFGRDFAPDLILSMHYRTLIPENFLQLASKGSVNLHPSLLPHYRGTNSVAWVLINGERETGFTYHRMDARFDTGAILLQERIPIEATDTAFSLFHRQITRAMRQLENVIHKVFSGDQGTVQVGEGSYYPRSLPYGGVIDENWPDEKVERFIRAMTFPPFLPAIVRSSDRDHVVSSMEEYRAIVMHKA